MKPHYVRLSLFLTLAASCVAFPLAGRALVGQTPDAAAPDSSATDKPPQPKIDDIAAQLRDYAERLGESLEDDGDYNELDQTRVEKDAATVAGLAWLLVKHDDDHALKPAAPALLAAASEITTHYRDFEPSAAGYKRLSATLATKEKPGDATTAKDASPPVAGTAMLMKQMRFIDNRLQRAAKRRPPTEKTRTDIAGHAATVAALAEPMSGDAKQFAKTADEVRLWQQQSADMAVAAARLNLLANDANAKDFSAAVRALDATCTRCHHDFRVNIANLR
ncbi:MAG: hypothetical protein WD875_18915 [Pirellulales bacterium]